MIVAFLKQFNSPQEEILWEHIKTFQRLDLKILIFFLSK